MKKRYNNPANNSKINSNLPNITLNTSTPTRSGKGYDVKGVEYQSATYLSNNVFCEAFNSEEVSLSCAGKGKYAGMTQAEVKAKWQQLAEEGSKLHDIIHRDLTGKDIKEEEVSEFIMELSHYSTFLEDAEKILKLIPFASEWYIQDDASRIAGIVDCLMVNQKGNYYLIDWKRTNISDYSHKKYSYQLNVYAQILKRSYGIDVGKNMFIVYLSPSLEKYVFKHAKVLKVVSDYFDSVSV